MRSTVNQPSTVNRQNVPLHGGNVPAVGEGLSIEEPRDERGKEEAQEGHQIDKVSGTRTCICVILNG